jgi:hypothetical protein
MLTTLEAAGLAVFGNHGVERDSVLASAVLQRRHECAVNRQPAAVRREGL